MLVGIAGKWDTICSILVLCLLLCHSIAVESKVNIKQVRILNIIHYYYISIFLYSNRYLSLKLFHCENRNSGIRKWHVDIERRSVDVHIIHLAVQPTGYIVTALRKHYFTTLYYAAQII